MRMRLPHIVMILACCAAGIACVSGPHHQTVYTQPTAEAVVPSGAEDQLFYDDLAPYGRWVYVSGPGWAWSPYNAPVGWRPYRLGHWVFTDYGWTWVSDESFGWAVYHYGRWHSDPAYGWVWVPGTEWGPAWVAWHEGGGWVGWAPLPWQVRWRAGVGLDWGGLNINVALGPSTWYFVQARDLVAPSLRHHIAPASRNVTLIQITKNVTNYIHVDNRIVDQSVKVEKIGRAVGHAIPRYRVREADSPEGVHGGKVRGEEFVVFRPNATRLEAAPQIGKGERDPSRFSKALEQQRKQTRTPHRPPAEAAPAQAAAPEGGAVPATSVETRSERVAPPARPAPANAQPDKPGRANTPPAKSKAKRPGDAGSKAGKPKPGGPDSKGSESEKSKPEKSKSGNED